MFSESEMQMESSLYGGRYNTHKYMRWEWSGSRSQRFSWGCGGERAGGGMVKKGAGRGRYKICGVGKRGRCAERKEGACLW